MEGPAKLEVLERIKMKWGWADIYAHQGNW
jgi:hypothetical protein